MVRHPHGLMLTMACGESVDATAPKALHLPMHAPCMSRCLTLQDTTLSRRNTCNDISKGGLRDDTVSGPRHNNLSHNTLETPDGTC